MQPGDRRLVAMQLGRIRYEPEAVVARCARDYPAAVLGFAARAPARAARGELSATLHWITCPWLKARISTLEAGGWIDHLRWLLARPESGALRAALEEAAGAYTTAVRRAHDGRSPGLFEARFGGRIMGIGGTAGADGMKCLHNHVAWMLAGGTSPIGAFALALVELDLAPRGLAPLDCGSDCAREPARFGLVGRLEV